MIYTITFKCHGKPYFNFQTVPGKCLSNQYEAVACGLLLGKIEQEGLSKEDKYVDACLYENDGKTEAIVWASQEYWPIGMEVKL